MWVVSTQRQCIWAKQRLTVKKWTHYSETSRFFHRCRVSCLNMNMLFTFDDCRNGHLYIYYINIRVYAHIPYVCIVCRGNNARASPIQNSWLTTTLWAVRKGLQFSWPIAGYTSIHLEPFQWFFLSSFGLDMSLIRSHTERDLAKFSLRPQKNSIWRWNGKRFSWPTALTTIHSFSSLSLSLPGLHNRRRRSISSFHTTSTRFVFLLYEFNNDDEGNQR